MSVEYDSLDLSFPRSHSLPVSSAVIKSKSSDFYVEELMAQELAGEGEHVWLWLEKTDQNSEYVAKQLAKFCGVKAMDIGLSGQKDRWAVTRQWMSVYLGNKPEPDWDSCELEGVSILKRTRHSKKLRRGEHFANHFKLLLSKVEKPEYMLPLLEKIKHEGFPNYYGLQRFGRSGANVSRAAKWFQGEIKVSRSQKSFYLSATRSYLFNLNLAELIDRGKFEELCSSNEAGPLYGDPVEGVEPLSEQENAILQQHSILAKGIHQNRMKLERRPYVVVPENMRWDVAGEEVTIEFDLLSGVFATSLLNELADINIGLGQTQQ